MYDRGSPKLSWLFKTRHTHNISTLLSLSSVWMKTACIHTKYADRMAKCLTYNVCTQSSASVLSARAACEATFVATVTTTLGFLKRCWPELCAQG